MRPNRYGFSLIEVLFSMLLIMTLLGMVATLMREYSDVSRYTAARDNTLDGVQFALEEMGHDLSSAQRVDSPIQGSPVGTSVSVLTFKRVDPDRQRFPDRGSLGYDDDGEPLMWNTRDATKWMTVSYQREPGSGALTRSTESFKGNETQKLVGKVDSMLVTTMSSGFYELSLSFKEDKGRLRRFTVVARKWVRV